MAIPGEDSGLFTLFVTKSLDRMTKGVKLILTGGEESLKIGRWQNTLETFTYKSVNRELGIRTVNTGCEETQSKPVAESECKAPLNASLSPHEVCL